jgi:chromosome segregation ATPase
MSDTPEESHIKELETTVEGLENQLRDVEGDAIRLSDEKDRVSSHLSEVLSEIDLHKKRYASAIKMIRSRQEALEAQRQAYQRLAEVLVNFRQEVINCTDQVRDLRNVPITSLDDAVSRVANRLDTAILG